MGECSIGKISGFSGLDRLEKISIIYRVSMFLNTLGSTLVGSVLVIFLSNTKGFGTVNTGIIIGLTPILVLPFIGLWGDTIDRSKKIVKFLTIINLLNAVLTFSLLFIDHFWLFFAVNFVKNVITIPAGSLSDEYLMFLVNNGNLPFGKIRIWGTLGYTFAGIAGPLILLASGIKGCISFGSVLVLVSAFVYRKMPEIVFEEKLKNPKVKAIDGDLDRWGSVKSLLKNRTYLGILLLTASIFGTMTAAGSYGNQSVLMGLNCPDEIIAALPFVMVFLEVIILRVMDRVDLKGKEYKLYLVATLIVLSRWLITAFADGYYLVVATCALHGLVSGLVLPVQNKLIAESVHDEQRSTAFLLVIVVSFTIVPALLNLLTSEISSRFGVHSFGIIYSIATVPCLVFITTKFIKKTR